MKHIKVILSHPRDERHFFGAKCKAPLQPDDQLVDAALASDCDECRTATGVALTNDKTWIGEKIGVRPEPSYTPEPMPNGEEICASAKANRL